MQPYVILKQPGKLIFYLFTIMFLIVRDSHEVGPCTKNCFGPANKIQIFNEASEGYLHVANRTTVVAKPDGSDGIIYKISAGPSFYLYDMKAEKFICWRRPHRTKQMHNRRQRVPSSLVARKFSNVNCQFVDKVSDNKAAYVYLVPAFNDNLKMRFNKSGFFVPHESVDRIRHRNRLKQANFLIQAYVRKEPNMDREMACQCPEARRHFCRSKFVKMKVFENICNQSNETYDS